MIDQKLQQLLDFLNTTQSRIANLSEVPALLIDAIDDASITYAEAEPYLAKDDNIGINRFGRS